ncbi:MAG: hypothetical protein UZ09_BCD002000656 [Bacteroidetes bacterium OLB9]|nr:MAG: hypothetical protein UZ09_BCD002000656 [Bacteroidetes bacterium OLB9]
MQSAKLAKICLDKILRKRFKWKIHKTIQALLVPLSDVAADIGKSVFKYG